MKKLTSVLLVFTLVSLTSKCQVQKIINEKEAISMINKFYTNYNREWSTGNPNTLKQRLYSLQNKYCTNRLIKKIRDPYFEHDPLTNDIYTDMDFLNTLSIVRDSSKSNTYVVTYIAHNPYYSKVHRKDPKEKVNIRLQIVKYNGELKIDKIW